MVNQSHKLSGPFIVELKNKFNKIAGDDNKIDKSEFQQNLSINNEKIINRIFDIFDKDRNGFLDVNEFIDGIENLIHGEENQKIKFAFDIHDIDASGDIDKIELKILIKNILIENNLDFDLNQIDLIVHDLFKNADVDGNGKIDFNEFLKLIEKYPSLVDSLAVNPTAWFNSQNLENNNDDFKSGRLKHSKVQVQNLSVLQWLLVPRLIYFYNIIINRNKNNNRTYLKSLELLPDKNISFLFNKPSWFSFQAGDYVYINCPWVSKLEWYPFNIISPTSNSIVRLNIKANEMWPKKIYDKTISMLNNENIENLQIRVDGPHGSSSNKILESKNLILVAAGSGIAKFASMLQDIGFRKKGEDIRSEIKSIHFVWLCDDSYYVEWFKKLLYELNNELDLINFDFSIHFLNRNASSLPKNMLYISKDIYENDLKIDILPGFRKKCYVGTPVWKEKLGKIISSSETKNNDFKLFYSGPKSLMKNIKPACKKFNITFYNN